MARTIRLARFAAEGFLKFVEVATARHPLPGHLPRQTRRYDPKDSACPDCACRFLCGSPPASQNSHSHRQWALLYRGAQSQKRRGFGVETVRRIAHRRSKNPCVASVATDETDLPNDEQA